MAFHSSATCECVSMRSERKLGGVCVRSREGERERETERVREWEREGRRQSESTVCVNRCVHIVLRVQKCLCN